MQKDTRSYCILFQVLILSCITISITAQVRHKKTVRQIQQLQKEKQARTALQRKIDSQLLQAIREHAGKKMTDGVELEPIKVQFDSNGNVPVDISARVSDSLLNKIKALGGQIIFPSKQYNTIRASVPIEQVETIACEPSVTFIQLAVQAVNNTGKSTTPTKGLAPPPVQ